MPGTALTLNLLASALRHHQAGELRDAERIYREILAIDPRHADSIHLLGMIAFQSGDNQLAEGMIRKAIAVNKREPLYQSNLGIVMQAQGRLEESVACYRRAVTLKPDYPEAHNNLGVTLGALGRPVEAKAEYERVLALNPSHAQAHTNLGVLLFDEGKVEQAIAHYEKALALKPNCAETYSNLGNAFDARDKLEAAVSCYVQAVTLKPDYATAFINLGNVLQAQNKFADAVACYEHVLALPQGSSPEARYSKALAQLLLGDFAEGWRNYGARWQTAGHTPMRTYQQPLWTGEKLSSGKLLLWGEQGVGDEIMFASMIPDVLRTGNQCILDCDPRLQPLFARSFPEVEVVSGMQSAGPEITAHLPTGSLPGLFRHTPQSFADGESPYLVADPVKRAEFRARYADGRRNVGLAWYTSNKKNGHRRSIDPALFAPLFARADLAWVSLQYGNHDDLEKQAAAAGAPLMVDRSVDQLADIDTFAAQIAALDLVITIDNSTAHLAAALGVPVWLLVPAARDWRWLLEREDSPWYPSMLLFRQPTFDDWPSVIQNVMRNL